MYRSSHVGEPGALQYNRWIAQRWNTQAGGRQRGCVKMAPAEIKGKERKIKKVRGEKKRRKRKRGNKKR